MGNDRIDDVAGKVWKALGEQGCVMLSTLPGLVDEDANAVQLAAVSLVRKGKVDYIREGCALSVRLTKEEAEAYRRQAACG